MINGGPHWYDERTPLFLDLEFDGHPRDPTTARIVRAVASYKGVYSTFTGDPVALQGLASFVASECDLDGPGFLVAHNAKAELGWLKYLGLELRRLVVYDTMLGEWVLRAGLPASEGGISLDGMATRRSAGVKDEWITMLFGSFKASPFKRDILKELTESCKAAGIRMCFYHSIMDWHQPDAESKKSYTNQNTQNPDWNKYRETYLKPQIKELLTNYDPGVMWFDGEWIPEWTEDQGKDLYNFIKEINPKIIINNRVGKGRKGMQGMNEYENAAGDFGTPEQEILEGTSNYDWESCMNMNDTWGYKKNDQNWKSSGNLIKNLIDVAAKGGNYL